MRGGGTIHKNRIYTYINLYQKLNLLIRVPSRLNSRQAWWYFVHTADCSFSTVLNSIKRCCFCIWCLNKSRVKVQVSNIQEQSGPAYWINVRVLFPWPSCYCLSFPFLSVWKTATFKGRVHAFSSANCMHEPFESNAHKASHHVIPVHAYISTLFFRFMTLFSIALRR